MNNPDAGIAGDWDNEPDSGPRRPGRQLFAAVYTDLGPGPGAHAADLTTGRDHIRVYLFNTEAEVNEFLRDRPAGSRKKAQWDVLRPGTDWARHIDSSRINSVEEGLREEIAALAAERDRLERIIERMEGL